jgi:hypothetical protein
MELSLTTTIKPMDVLRACLHSDVTTTIQTAKTLTVSGGPLWTNSISNNGIIVGNLEATTLTRQGIVLGSVSTPPAHTDPSFNTIWAYYLAKATTLPSATDWNKVVLGPGYNPWGAANADGVYYIKTNNQHFRVRASRILGTLLVDVGTDHLHLEDEVLIQSFRADYPVVLVKGDVEFHMKSTSKTLSESDQNVNYNRAGVPYGGVTDTDQSDTYPVQIEGLMHVQGTVLFKENTKIRGTLLSTGAVTIEASPQLTHEPTLLTNPPLGYKKYFYPPVAGGWKRVVD